MPPISATSHHNRYMLRAFYLALHGREKVNPNPRVGCVVVKNKKVIGEGWHMACGGAHAEVRAMRGLSRSQRAGSDVYVTLEPCAHQGKTPPCADRLIEAGVKRVFIAIGDENPLVADKGIKKIQQAGVEVQVNTHPELGYWVNRRFFTFLRKKRPYIILKWAQSKDGYLAPKSRQRTDLSNPYSRILSHSWRAQEDAVLVGFRTAYHDNPRLTSRHWHGKSPLRVVLDEGTALPATQHLFTDGHPTVVYTRAHGVASHGNVRYRRLRNDKAHVKHVVEDLHKQGLLSLMVEGGANTLNAFLMASLWDEIRIFHTTKMLGGGVSAPEISQLTSVQRSHLSVLGDRLVWLTREKYDGWWGMPLLTRLL